VDLQLGQKYKAYGEEQSTNISNREDQRQKKKAQDGRGNAGLHRGKRKETATWNSTRNMPGTTKKQKKTILSKKKSEITK